LYKEANPNSKITRHDGHPLPNGKTGKPHWQKKKTDGSHAFYESAAGFIGAGATIGKNIFGDNIAGNFIDDWINPIGDLNEIVEAVSEINEESDDENEGATEEDEEEIIYGEYDLPEVSVTPNNDSNKSTNSESSEEENK